METTTLPTTPTIKVGAKVAVDDPKFPGVWMIKSIGPKNVVVIPDAGGRGLRCPKWMLKNVDDATAAAAAAAAPYIAYFAGEVVRVTKEASKTDTSALWVVLVDKGEKINIAKLGGDGNRYLRVPRSWLAKVDLADVLK